MQKLTAETAELNKKKTCHLAFLKINREAGNICLEKMRIKCVVTNKFNSSNGHYLRSSIYIYIYSIVRNPLHESDSHLTEFKT